MKELDSEALSAAHLALRAATARYLFNPRVSLIDFGFRILDRQGYRPTDEPCLRIHVRDKPRGERLELLESEHPDLYPGDGELQALERTYGFRVDLPKGDYRPHVVTDVAPTLVPPAAPPPTVSHVRALDPMRGGISVGNTWIAGAGTLGGKVKDRKTGADMILSNWHVLAGRWWLQRGTPICQPGRLDGGTDDNVVARLERDAWGSRLDAAVATLLPGTRSLMNDQLEIGPVEGTTMPNPWIRVEKSGRTTKVTSGIVTSILPGRMLAYPDGIPRTVRNIWAIEPEYEGGDVSAHGDSGSAWMETDTRRVVGLHFAGESVPSRALAMGITPVLDALGVDIALT